MRLRHKAPSTFSLWMVDVICCSLGSVLFLWLVADKKLLDTSNEEARLIKLLADVNKELDATKKSSGELDETRRKRIDELLGQLLKLETNKEAAEKLLADRLKKIEELDEKLGGLLKQNIALREDKTKQTVLTAEKQKKIDELLAELSKLADNKEAVEKELAKKNKAMEALQKTLALLGKEKSTLEEDLQGTKAESQKRQKSIDELAKQAEELARKLLVAEAAVRQLEKTAKLLPKLEDELKNYRERLSDEETKKKLLETNLAKRLEEMTKASKDFETLLLAKRALEKKLEGVSKELIDALAMKEKLTEAEKEKTNLLDLVGKKGKDLEAALDLLSRMKGDTARLRALAEQRFAGIALTGKKVVFVVDTSGSMDLVDENTTAPTKWAGVCETVAHVMKSLPDLEKFQVVAFSEEVSYPLGKEGEWLDFDAKTTPDKVRNALLKIKPSGGTDLHKGFKAAFNLRAKGLDTVYLFSDGLPSDGEGLTAEQDRTIKDSTVRSALLSKHLRKKLKEEWNKSIESQPQVRINAVGFFYESPDVGAFLWALAREHDGSFVGMSKP